MKKTIIDRDEYGEFGGGSCLSLIVLIFLLYGLFAWVPTPWGTYTYDLFPPAIHQK